jgi:hypothetical protein
MSGFPATGSSATGFAATGSSATGFAATGSSATGLPLPVLIPRQLGLAAATFALNFNKQTLRINNTT